MSTVNPSLRRGLNGARNMSVLRTVLVYQNRDAGLQAKRFCERIERDLGLKCQLNDRAWRFDILAVPEARNAAASAAANADLVIFSKSDCVEVPEKVEEWLDMWMWLIDQGNPALIALFGAPRCETASVCNKLRGVARNNGIDFFSTTIPQEARSEQIRFTRQQSTKLGRGRHFGPFG